MGTPVLYRSRALIGLI